jgi:hypothetical protein
MILESEIGQLNDARIEASGLYDVLSAIDLRRHNQLHDNLGERHAKNGHNYANISPA